MGSQRGIELAAIKSELPLTYRWFRANGLKRLVPWHFADGPALIEAWRQEYAVEVDGTSDILPFAFRQDMDTIAGFLVAEGTILDRVMTPHLSWIGRKDMFQLREGQQPSLLDPNDFPTFKDWFSSTMVPDSIAWTNEEDLDAIKSGTWPNFNP